MQKRIFFFDIDGTLINENKKIPSSTIKAINELQRLGHITAIASGRAPFMIKQIVKDLNIDYIVSFNGSLVLSKDKIIYENLLDQSECQKISKLANDLGHAICWQSGEGMAAEVDHPIINATMAHLKVGFPPVDSEFFNREKIYQGLLFVNDDEQKNYPEYEHIRYLRWHPDCIDLIPTKGSKAEGIQKLVDTLGFDISDTVAFGDANNDIEMITTVGLGIAMGNAIEELKEVADDVTLSVDHDGIYHALLKHGFIQS